jgi:hypothetical protein
VTDIHGSSMDAMAKAVEQSKCVLLCITDKYRQSPNFQAEALYAFKLKKPMVPLIMETGLEDVQGWLGILMADRIYINFAKKTFQECIERLKGEIQSYHGHNNTKINNNDNIVAVVSNNSIIDKKNQNLRRHYY